MSVYIIPPDFFGYKPVKSLFSGVARFLLVSAHSGPAASFPPCMAGRAAPPVALVSLRSEGPLMATGWSSESEPARGAGKHLILENRCEPHSSAHSLNPTAV